MRLINHNEPGLRPTTSHSFNRRLHFVGMVAVVINQQKVSFTSTETTEYLKLQGAFKSK